MNRSTARRLSLLEPLMEGPLRWDDMLMVIFERAKVEDGLKDAGRILGMTIQLGIMKEDDGEIEERPEGTLRLTSRGRRWVRDTRRRHGRSATKETSKA